MTKDRKNWYKAWCYFVSNGEIPADAKKNEWCLHHKDPTLKYVDRTRYDEWRVEDLVPMLKAEHSRLHCKGHQLTELQRRAISERMRGHEVTEETRLKLSKAFKGRKWTAEAIRKRSETVHKNWLAKPKPEKKLPKPMAERQLRWITNGIEHKRVAPDAQIPEGWRPGRLGFKRSYSPKLGRMSEEHKMKISNSRKGMKFSEEHRRNLSISHMKKEEQRTYGP